MGGKIMEWGRGRAIAMEEDGSIHFLLPSSQKDTVP